MKFDLYATACEHIVVAAHRGVSGGNIPCNTLAAYDIALLSGADMLETDISKTLDGELIIFHPGMERSHLDRADLDLSKLTYEEIKPLRYVNYDRAPTQFGIVRFDDFLEEYKGRCYINIDKFWYNPKEIYTAIKRHGMVDQMLVKSAVSKEVLGVLSEIAPDIPYMSIVENGHPMHKSLMDSGINYVGAEVLFDSEDSVLCSDEFIGMMHKDKKIVWVNSIIYNYRKQLSAAHSDDTAFTVSRDYGWGWLADRGFDVIQTDWTLMLTEYLKSSGRYFRVK